MTPSVPAAAGFLAAMLRNDVLPEMTGFRAGNVGMAAAMLDMIAQEWDRAAARLLAENRAFRTLINRGDPDGEPEPAELDLRISSLEAANDALRRRLIALHADIEKRDDPAARELETEIWNALRRSVEDRRLTLANF